MPGSRSGYKATNFLEPIQVRHFLKMRSPVQAPAKGLQNLWKAWTGLLLLGCFTGCTIAPHGSRATHDVWTYANGQLVRHDRWTDRSAGGGMLLLMDPKAQSVNLSHTNSVLQTGGMLIIGDGSVTVDPQTGAIISAAGTAVGNVIGAAAKTAAKP